MSNDIRAYFVDQTYSFDDMINVSTHNSSFVAGMLDKIFQIDKAYIKFTAIRAPKEGEKAKLYAELQMTFVEDNGVIGIYSFREKKYLFYNLDIRYTKDSNEKGITYEALDTIKIPLVPTNYGAKRSRYFQQLLLRITFNYYNIAFNLYHDLDNGNKKDEKKDQPVTYIFGKEDFSAGTRYVYGSYEYDVLKIPDNNYNYHCYAVENPIYKPLTTYDPDDKEMEINESIVIPLYWLWLPTTEGIAKLYFDVDKGYEREGTTMCDIDPSWIVDKRPVVL